jgi:exonuclease SbcD
MIASMERRSIRLLHTADFHAGRVLKGRNRTPEIAAVLREIAQLASSEDVDAVLVAGDLYDSGNPGAEAEAAIFEFFLTLKEAGIPSVVIAGNHDSPPRLESVAGLLSWVGAQVVAALQPQDLGASVRSLQTRHGSFQVAALPYLSERRLVKAAELLAADLGAWRMKYQEGMAFFIRQLSSRFDPGVANVLMMHGTVTGAVPSGSERDFAFDMANAYTVDPQLFPSSASYVALGHIHFQQPLAGLVPARYCGSPLQLDFGEAGQEKGVILAELEPQRPAQVHFLPLSSGKPLLNLRASLDDLDQRLDALVDYPGWIKVVVELPPGRAISGLRDAIVRRLPNVLAVDLDQAKPPEDSQPAARSGLGLAELYGLYYQQRLGALPPAVAAAFSELDAEVREASRSGQPL